MNDNTEVRDELARLAGWRFVQSTDTAAFPHWVNDDGSPCLDAESEYVHPIPNTLDEAAKLHSDWGWNEVVFAPGGRRATASAYRKSTTGMRTSGFQLDEKAARFCVRLAVEKIEHERRGGQP